MHAFLPYESNRSVLSQDRKCWPQTRWTGPVLSVTGRSSGSQSAQFIQCLSTRSQWETVFICIWCFFCLDDSFAARVLLTFSDWLDGTGRSLLGRCIMRSICIWPYPRIAFYLKRTEEGQGWPGSPSAVPWASVASEFVLPGPIETLHPVPAHQAGTPEHRAKFRKSLLCQGLTWDFMHYENQVFKVVKPQKIWLFCFYIKYTWYKSKTKKSQIT